MSTLTAHFDLPLNTTAPSWARYAVAAVLGGWGLRDLDRLDGLKIIDSLTDRWCVRSHQGGKRVRAGLQLCPGDGVIAGGTGRTEPA